MSSNRQKLTITFETDNESISSVYEAQDGIEGNDIFHAWFWSCWLSLGLDFITEKYLSDE